MPSNKLYNSIIITIHVPGRMDAHPQLPLSNHPHVCVQHPFSIFPFHWVPSIPPSIVTVDHRNVPLTVVVSSGSLSIKNSSSPSNNSLHTFTKLNGVLRDQYNLSWNENCIEKPNLEPEILHLFYSSLMDFSYKTSFAKIPIPASLTVGSPLNFYSIFLTHKSKF